VAVAVGVDAFLVLDEAYRIVEVSPAARAIFGPLQGRDVFESFPDSRPLFLPYYEQARRSGEVVEFTQYYGGYVMRLKAVPAASMLTVSWEKLHVLDVHTLEGLRDSLVTMLDILEARDDAQHREAVRRALRVVQGGQ
jgi:PAS domain-containing protein